MMNEEKNKIRKNLERLSKLVTIRFDSYEDYCNWKFGLGLESEVLRFDYVENGKRYTDTRVFLDGKFNTIEAICKVELPF